MHYGEITNEGIEILLKELDLNENDIFFDLGSGKGKLVYEIAKITPVKQSIGIEYNKSRYNESIKFVSDRIKFLNENMINSDLSQGTVFYLCSTCYSEDLLAGILDKIKNNKNLKYIISLKKYDKIKKVLPKVKKIKIQTTWNKSGSPCRIYCLLPK